MKADKCWRIITPINPIVRTDLTVHIIQVDNSLSALNFPQNGLKA